MLMKFKPFIRVVMLTSLLLTGTVFADTSKFFSPQNFQALKNDPNALFSKANTCQLISWLGKKDYDLYSQAMSIMTQEDDDPNFVSISGNVKGLFTVFEGFFRLSKDGKVWIAYLYIDKVHYFTNDQATLQQPPAIISKWSSRFEKVQWERKLLAANPNNC